MKKALLAMISVAVIGMSFDKMPDFGPNGLKGLDETQKATLSAGESVLTKTISHSGGQRALIEIAVVFNQPIEGVWTLLSNPENQIHFLEDMKDLKIIKKTSTEDNVECLLKFFFLDVIYRVIRKVDHANYYIHWWLDPNFDNNIQDLRGFWRFYPYGEGKTLGRYGTRVTILKLIPSFIENYLIRKNLPKALASVKNYVDSGGTYRKASK